MLLKMSYEFCLRMELLPVSAHRSVDLMEIKLTSVRLYFLSTFAT